MSVGCSSSNIRECLWILSFAVGGAVGAGHPLDPPPQGRLRVRRLPGCRGVRPRLPILQKEPVGTAFCVPGCGILWSASIAESEAPFGGSLLLKDYHLVSHSGRPEHPRPRPSFQWWTTTSTPLPGHNEHGGAGRGYARRGASRPASTWPVSAANGGKTGAWDQAPRRTHWS